MTSSAINALELAYSHRMRRISVDGNGNVPPSTATAVRCTRGLDIDYSAVDGLSPAPSFASSFASQSSSSAESDWGSRSSGRSGLSRCQGSQTLSSYCSTSTEEGRRRVLSCDAVPTAGWGYFADVPPPRAPAPRVEIERTRKIFREVPEYRRVYSCATAPELYYNRTSYDSGSYW